MPGARNIHVENKLQEFADTRSRFRSITVLVGGNDAATSNDQFDLASSAQCMRDIVDLSKQMSEDVTVAEIPPRFEPTEAMGHIKVLNEQYQSISMDLSVKFAPNHQHFLLQNGEMNDGYFHDAVHLTLKGSNKLAETLGLTVNGKNGVCSFKPSQKYCYDHKEINSPEFDHVFWLPAKQKAGKPKAQKQKLPQSLRQQTDTPPLNAANVVPISHSGKKQDGLQSNYQPAKKQPTTQNAAVITAI